jgi:hypothetical protein
MDGTEVGVFEETDQVGLRTFLQRIHCITLEAEVRLEVLRDLPDEPLERELPDKRFCTLLVFADLHKGPGAGAEAVGSLGLFARLHAFGAPWCSLDGEGFAWFAATFWVVSCIVRLFCNLLFGRLYVHRCAAFHRACR